MTSRDFCYWLQGYFEIAKAGNGSMVNGVQLDRFQVECIQKHLSMVFYHEIDPSFGGKLKQEYLDNLHSPAGAVKVTSDNPVNITADPNRSTGTYNPGIRSMPSDLLIKC